MPLRISTWVVAVVLMALSLLSLPSIGMFIAPAGLIALAAAAILEIRADGLPVAGQITGITIAAMTSVLATAYSIAEHGANECTADLNYPCTESNSEYLWGAVAVAAAAATVLQIWRFVGYIKRHTSPIETSHQG